MLHRKRRIEKNIVFVKNIRFKIFYKNSKKTHTHPRVSKSLSDSVYLVFRILFKKNNNNKLGKLKSTIKLLWKER